MKTKKSILLVALSLCLVACGTKPASTTSAPATETPTTAAPTEAPTTEAPTEAPSTETPTETPTTEAEPTTYQKYQDKKTELANILKSKLKATSNTDITNLNNQYFEEEEAMYLELQATLQDEDEKAAFIAEGGQEEYDYVMSFDASKMFNKMEFHEVDLDAMTANYDEIIKRIEDKESKDVLFPKFETFVESLNDLIDMDELISVYADLYTSNRYYSTQENTLDTGYDTQVNNYKQAFQNLLKDDYYYTDAVTYFELTEDDIDYFLSAEIYDDETMALKEQETTLENSYETTLPDDERNEIYLNLLNVRKQLAAAYGYSNYLEYAYNEIYERSYSIEDSQNMIDSIRNSTFHDTFTALADSYSSCESTISSNKLAENVLLKNMYLIDNVVPDAHNYIRDLQTYGYYNFDVRSDKYTGSYETTVCATKDIQFITVATAGNISDYCSVYHETGHYLADQMADPELEGDKFDLDIAEVDSQGLEYLLLRYMNKFMQRVQLGAVTKYQLFNALWTIMSGCAIASLENYVYTTEEELTTPMIQTYFNKQIAHFTYPYSFGYDSTTKNNYYTVVPHIISSPGYYISYVNSIIPSLEIWALGASDLEGAAAKYRTVLSYGTSNEFTYVLEQAGLDSPFEQTTIDTIADVLATYAG